MAKGKAIIMTWAEVIENDLKESAEFAATYLRDALADEEPGTVIVALQHVARARGGIEDLALSLNERAELANAVSRGFAAIPGWYKTLALQAA
jgi:DNA-binding phage protein